MITELIEAELDEEQIRRPADYIQGACLNSSITAPTVLEDGLSIVIPESTILTTIASLSPWLAGS